MKKMNKNSVKYEYVSIFKYVNLLHFLVGANANKASNRGVYVSSIEHYSKGYKALPVLMSVNNCTVHCHPHFLLKEKSVILEVS